MIIDKASFLAGIQKCAEDLSLTKGMLETIEKMAGVFNTDDDLSSIVNQPEVMSADSDWPAAKALINHAAKPMAAGGLIGAGAGAGLGHIFSDKDSKKKNTAIGAGLGGLLGGLAGGANDLRQLSNNSQ